METAPRTAGQGATEHDPHEGMGVSSERVIESHNEQLIDPADGEQSEVESPDVQTPDVQTPDVKTPNVEGTGTKGTARGHPHGTLDTSRVTDQAG